MRYRLADKGRVFSTRERGARVLADLEAEFGRTHSEPVTIDFAGVVSISYSFADEFVGELNDRAAAGRLPRPQLENVDPRLQRVIDRSLRTRKAAALKGDAAVVGQRARAAGGSHQAAAGA